MFKEVETTKMMINLLCLIFIGQSSKDSKDRKYFELHIEVIKKRSVDENETLEEFFFDCSRTKYTSFISNSFG